MNQILAGPIETQTVGKRLEELAYLHGQAYDSYLSTEGQFEKFWSSDHQGVIAYAKVGRYLHVQGGLLAPVESRSLLLKEFFEFVERSGLVATFYNIGEDDLPLFRERGFQVTKWGEEPILDLKSITWAGHEFEWVRRQANYCRRQQCVVTECDRDDYTVEEWNELMDQVRGIAAECLSTKPQRGDVRFFNGQVDPPSWDRRRLFVARSDHGAGRIEGFLICLPFDSGRQWSIETYRHRLDAPRGIVPFMIHQAVESLKLEGIDAVSLCLCPAVRYEKLAGDSWIIRRCLQFGFNYAAAFFDMPGEYHFKSRFRPRFVRRFICHWPRASVGSMWSTVKLSAALDLDWGKLLQNLWQQVARPKTRKNLAIPKQPEPVVAELQLRPRKRAEDRQPVVSS